MGITKENVVKALDELESHLPQDEEFSKASEQDLDQPEGADLGNPAKKKMSDAAPKGATKKSEKSEEAEEEAEEKEEMAEEKEEKSEKSFSEDLPEEIETKIEVSDFLKSLVDHTGDAIDSLSQVVRKSEEENSEKFENLAKAVIELHEGQGKLAVVLKAICERIGVIENQPAEAPRSDKVTKSGAVEREFNDTSVEQGEPIFKGLSPHPHVAKSQISHALCDLVKKGEAEDTDVISFESSNYLKPELVTKLKEVFN